MIRSASCLWRLRYPSDMDPSELSYPMKSCEEFLRSVFIDRDLMKVIQCDIRMLLLNGWDVSSLLGREFDRS